MTPSYSNHRDENKWEPREKGRGASKQDGGDGQDARDQPRRRKRKEGRGSRSGQSCDGAEGPQGATAAEGDLGSSDEAAELPDVPSSREPALCTRLQSDPPQYTLHLSKDSGEKEQRHPHTSTKPEVHLLIKRNRTE